MKKKRTTGKEVRCIVYIATVGDMQHVNQREQRQMQKTIRNIFMIS